MSAARRSLLTATAAAALLGALWFVPTAHATPDKPAPAAHTQPATDTSRGAPATLTTSQSAATAAAGTGRLADTGGVNTTPYLMAGTAFLGLGAAFIAYSVRRDHAKYEADPELAGA